MDAVLNWVWQGIVVAAALFILLKALEHAHANVRYVVCSSAMLMVLAIPVVWALFPTSAVPRSAAHLAVGPVVAVPATPWTSATAMLGLWGLWIVAQGLRLARALVGLRRARRTCGPFPIEVEQRLRHWMSVRARRRRARLVLSDAVGRAAVLGCGKPLIAVAPALVERLSASELDCVIVHEWAHVQRRDDLVSILQFAVRVVAGWHPAVWWIDRRLQVEREVACDEMAVAVTGSAKSYASCLVKLADLSPVTWKPLAAPGVLTAGSLSHRVRRIVSQRGCSSMIWSRGLGAAVVAALLTLAAGVASFELFAAVNSPQAPGEVMALPAPEEQILPSGIDVDPKPRPQETRTNESVARLRVAQSVPGLPIQTATTISPRDVPSAWLPIALQAEPGAGRQQVEREAAAVEVSAAAGDTERRPDTVAPRADVERADARSPWVAAGDAGVDIGRRSTAAGVATAGFFSRFARRVAGSF